MGIYSTDVTTYPQTQAQWDADPRILPPNVVAVVTDGANIGRKKWFDDVHTFAELDYTDAAESPSAGQAFGIPMTYSNATAGAPAEGVFRFDSTTAGSIANVFINMTAPTGVDNAGQWTLNNPQRGYFKATHAGGDTLFQFNGEGANNGGVYEAPAVHLSGPLPANNAPCRVVYLPGPAASGTLVLPWRMWGTDEPYGKPTVPTTLTDFFATDPFTIAFGPDDNAGIRVFLQMPDNYSGGAIGVRISGPALLGSGGNAIMYANAIVTASGNVLAGTADGLSLNTGTLNLTGSTDGDLYSITINVTPSGDTWAAGSMLALLVGRNAANVLDTHDESVYFTSATVTY